MHNMTRWPQNELPNKYISQHLATFPDNHPKYLNLPQNYWSLVLTIEIRPKQQLSLSRLILRELNELIEFHLEDES